MSTPPPAPGSPQGVLCVVDGPVLPRVAGKWTLARTTVAPPALAGPPLSLP